MCLYECMDMSMLDLGKGWDEGEKGVGVQGKGIGYRKTFKN